MLKIVFLAICWFVFSCISNSKMFEGKSPCAILDLSLPPVGIVHPQSRCIMWMELKNDLAQKLIWNSRSVAFKVSIRFYAMLLSPTLVSYTIIFENLIFHCLFRICVWAGRTGRFKRMLDTSECMMYGILLMDSIPCEIYYVSHVYLENQHYCWRKKCSHRQAQTKIPAESEIKTWHVTKDCERRRPQKLGSEEKTLLTRTW